MQIEPLFPHESGQLRVGCSRHLKLKGAEASSLCPTRNSVFLRPLIDDGHACRFFHDLTAALSRLPGLDVDELIFRLFVKVPPLVHRLVDRLVSRLVDPLADPLVD